MIETSAADALRRRQCAGEATAVTALARTTLFQYELRSGDAIQLASALWMRRTVPLAGLLAFDTRLVAAAVAERFTVPPMTGRRRPMQRPR
jgi:hypothetical protein